MQAHRLRATVTEDHKLTIENLPFPAGEEVEIIVLAEVRQGRQRHYPLRGLPIRYERPVDPVADSDWQALP